MFRKAAGCDSSSCVEVDFVTAGGCEAGTCVEVGFAKASNCDTGACVEVNRDLIDKVGVRDSKDGEDGPVLWFTREEWQVFVGGVKKGEFDI